MGEAQAFQLLGDVDELYVARGKKVVEIQLKRENPDRDTLRKLLLGPTGNLRAPTVRRGRTLVVGFDRGMYERLFSRGTADRNG